MVSTLGKKAMRDGIIVNDNKMIELTDICTYLKLDFRSYFEDYHLKTNENMFKGNY